MPEWGDGGPESSTLKVPFVLTLSELLEEMRGPWRETIFCWLLKSMLVGLQVGVGVVGGFVLCRCFQSDPRNLYTLLKIEEVEYGRRPSGMISG